MTLTCPLTVDIVALDAAVLADRKYQRWSDAPSHQGYSGLLLRQQPDGTGVLTILWTDNGTDARPLVLTAAQERAVQRVVDQWVAAHGG